MIFFLRLNAHVLQECWTDCNSSAYPVCQACQQGMLTAVVDCRDG